MACYIHVKNKTGLGRTTDALLVSWKTTNVVFSPNWDSNPCSDNRLFTLTKSQSVCLGVSSWDVWVILQLHGLYV